MYFGQSRDLNEHTLKPSKVFRPLSRPANFVQPRTAAFQLPSTLHARLLSTETRAAIDKAVATAPVVLFMKGTPETPQCGFSRASIQILGLQGVDPKKFVAFNVLEDLELRQGKLRAFIIVQLRCMELTMSLCNITRH